VFHVSIWGAWSFVWGVDKPTKARPVTTGLHQRSLISQLWIALT